MACQPLEYRTKVLGNTVLSLGIRPPPETNQALGIPPGSFFDEVVRSRGLEPPHPYGYMHLKHARLPIPPRPQTSNSFQLARTPTSSGFRTVCRVPTRA